MFKKAMVLAVAVTGLVAFAVPTTASAVWTETFQNPQQGKVEEVHIPQNKNIEVTGQAKFQGQVGNVECQFISAAQLVSQTTTASAQFDVDNNKQANDEEKCSVGGGLVTLGCTDVEQVTVTGSFEAHVTSKTIIDVTTGTIQNHLTGGIFCPPTLQLTPGTVTIQTVEDWWKQGQLSGTLKLHPNDQQVTITGSGSIIPASKYGLTS